MIKHKLLTKPRIRLNKPKEKRISLVTFATYSIVAFIAADMINFFLQEASSNQLFYIYSESLIKNKPFRI